MLKAQKGHHGYIDRKKKILFAEVLLLVIGIIGFVIIGILVSGSRKNLLTIAAILSVLPMVNQLVVLIALMKYRSLSQEDYDEVSACAGDGVLDTELVITSRNDKSFCLDYAFIHENGVICYCSDKKRQAKEMEEYIQSFMKNNHLKTDIFILRDRKNFLQRIKELKELKPCSRKECDEKLLKIEGVLRGISI